MNPLTNNSTLISELSTLGFVEIDKPILTYDTLSKQVVFTFIGRNYLTSSSYQNKEYIIEIRLKVTDVYSIDRVYVYAAQDTQSTPIVYMPISITAIAGEEFSLPIAADDTSTSLNVQLTTSTAGFEKYNSFISNIAYLDTLNAINNK
jgi:hypothetical protein